MKHYLLLASLFCILFGYAQQPGTIDTAFGANGKVEHTVTVGTTLFGISLSDMYKLPSGKILAVGVATSGCSSQSSYSGILARFNTDGSFDTTFNTVGYTLTPGRNFRDLHWVDDNTFYITSLSDIRRIDANGTVDTTFGTNGELDMSVSSSKLQIDSNGNFYVLGNASSSRKLQKYLPSGTLDMAFGTNGVVTFDSAFSFQDFTLDTNNQPILVGRDYANINSYKLIAVKLMPNGTYDTTFADNGIFRLQAYVRSRAYKVAWDTNNNLLIAGSGNYGGYLGLVLAKLDATGALDTSFSTDGYLHQRISSDSNPSHIQFLPDNGFYISGTGFNRLYMIKYFNDGSLDLNFGTDNTGYFFTEHIPNTTLYSRATAYYDDYVLMVNAESFAHCAQTKYKATFYKYFIEATLGVDDTEQFSVSVGPNPFKDTINIASKVTDFEVVLYDVFGKQIATFQNETQLDTSSLTSGLYLLTITAEGEKETFKLVKQ